jgi:hypothetical protein
VTPPAGLEGKRVEIERPETPERVRSKLVEGELHYTRLAGRVEVSAARLDALQEAHRAAREDLSIMRDTMREMSVEIRDVDRRLDGIAEVQASQSQQIQALREGQIAHTGRLEALHTAQGLMAKDVRSIVEALGRRDAVEVDRAQGQGGALPALAPITAEMTPVTSAGQARRAAVVGGGGVGLATVLGAVSALTAPPPALQWALVALAVVAGVGAVAVAVRWGWTAAGR